MSDLSIAPVVCVRCGISMAGQYYYLGALGPLCGRCFGEEMAANRAAYQAAYQAVPAYGAEAGCEPRVRELEAGVERLREALLRVVAHTGHTKSYPDELHIGLLASIARIAKGALREAQDGE